MQRRLCLFIVLAVAAATMTTVADSGTSTRIVDPRQHAGAAGGRYPYRDKSDYILQELDLRPGDVVVDIGAGDGWWSRQMAGRVGAEGAIHAAEVQQQMVERMKRQFVDVPQIKPYLCPMDSTGLPDNSCDLAFLSKTYHHLSNHVSYLRHLQKVVRPTGRLCVIERYPKLADEGGREHAWCPGLLIQQAAEAGWVLVRCEMIAGTYHYIAIFVSNDLFMAPANRGN